MTGTTLTTETAQLTSYRFGALALASDVPLPGFEHRCGPAQADGGPARFSFRLTAWAPPPADDGRVVLRSSRGPRQLLARRGADGSYVLAVPDVAGCTLLPDRHTLRWHVTGPPTTRDAEFLVATALPRLATAQHGLVVHAGTIAGPRGAVLLCGASGAGKSTLASAVAARTGWPLIGDDAVALDVAADGVWAHGFNPDVRVRAAGAGKRRVATVDPATGPVPARLVLRLVPGQPPATHPLRPADQLVTLHRNLLRLDRADPAVVRWQLAGLAAAARHLPVVDLHHPRTPDSVAATTERIIALAASAS
ncbi:MAG TPA: hypothetical protein VES42_14420 [Pilimelia sp.]|nr:hypothetical protein [Pilimelia sp.]